MGWFGWLLIVTGMALCLVVGVVWGAGEVYRFYEALARDNFAQVADLSKENTELRACMTRDQRSSWDRIGELAEENTRLRADLVRWQNERLSL